VEFEEIPPIVYLHILIFDAKGGTGGPAKVNLEHAEWRAIDSARPTLDGHTFLGWSENESAQIAHFQPGQWIYIENIITLYAVWRVN